MLKRPKWFSAFVLMLAGRGGGKSSRGLYARNILFGIALLLLFVPTALAETIYLKDGRVVRARITSEDDKTIFVETNDTWQRIDKSNIEHIVKDDTVPEESTRQAPQTEKSVETHDQPRQPGEKRSTKNVDIRLKLGNAAGVNEIEFDSNGFTEDIDNDRHGSNVQLEVAISPFQDSMFGPVFSAGLFSRRHSGSGTIAALSEQTTIDYDAGGLSLAGGLRIKANENFHFEVKLEIAGGQGDVKLSTPNFVWDQTRDGSYASVGLIAGWYYAFSKPGFQLGLELGAQSFTGDFEIWNNAGRWEDASVSGSSGIANLVLGYRF